VVSPTNQTIAILLTNRVHPTRDTVSTSPTRREFARKVADAIPVEMDKKGEAWFAGYGDYQTKQLTAEVNLDNKSTLTFDTWYKIEDGYDKGIVEISSDGVEWTEAAMVTGSSNDWETKDVSLPADTKFVRFTYLTDGSVNNRGWYVDDVKLNGSTLTFTSKEWVERSY
ncbi:beta-lactamase, partial [Halobacillus sp. BBL2006]